jgi:hypothetical protein
LKEKGILTVQFYADDGFIGGKDHELVQNALSLFKENFMKFGLAMNVEKTESMILIGNKPVHKISDEAYHKMITGEGESFDDKQITIIQCEICDATIKRMSSKRHQLSARCKRGRKTIAINTEVESFCQPVNYDLEETNIVSTVKPLYMCHSIYGTTSLCRTLCEETWQQTRCAVQNEPPYMVLFRLRHLRTLFVKSIPC